MGQPEARVWELYRTTGDVPSYNLHRSDMPVRIPSTLHGLTLWRYMSLEKLLAIIQTHSL